MHDLDGQATQLSVFYRHSEQRVSIIIVTREKMVLMEDAHRIIDFAFLFLRI
jgi:hypothetical protein